LPISQAHLPYAGEAYLLLPRVKHLDAPGVLCQPIVRQTNAAHAQIVVAPGLYLRELVLSGYACIGYYTFGESNINIGENDVEAGYWVARPYWNRGICTEALRLLIDYCFNEKGVRTIWSDFFVDNPASGRVMEKCGFRDTGEINYCSRLQLGSDRPVKVMKLTI